jgi:hypothetical protein
VGKARTTNVYLGASTKEDMSMIHANEMIETLIARPIEDGRLNSF